MSDGLIPETDAAEAKRRAEWLHKHKAPKNWIILTMFEVSTIRTDLMALERERDEARMAGVGYSQQTVDAITNEREQLRRERDEARGHCESIVEKAKELIARWDQPPWKDAIPTARFINALRIAVRAYEEKP